MQKLTRSVLIILVLLCASTAYLFRAPGKIAVVEQPVPAAERPYREINLDLIRRITCFNPKTGDGGTGTAWVIARDTMVTAAHVTEDRCFDVATQGVVTVTHVDWENDFAILQFATGSLPSYVRYSCDGFRSGERYVATGWRQGARLVQTSLVAEQWVTDPATLVGKMRSVGLRFMVGNLYHGMSGGPIFSDHGEVVGISSATDDDGTAYGRDLRDTKLCGAPRRNAPDQREITRS